MVQVDRNGLGGSGLKLPWAAVLAIIGYVGAGVWWSATLNARVDAIQSAIDTPKPLQERLATIETQQATLIEGVRMLTQQLGGPAGPPR
jgi:hypothetical protein